MSHEFIAYIDESGDDGLARYREPMATGGASHWLVLSCCVVRSSNDRQLVALRDGAREAIGQTDRQDIHFAELDHSRKTVVVDHVRRMPIKAISVLSYKRHIPQGVYERKGQLYWYLCRYLLERVSWLCSRRGETTRPLAKLVFSNRGGLRYDEFRDYVDRLRRMDTSIDWRAISSAEDCIASEAHQRLAGLQIADVIARSFAEAVEPNRYGYFEPSYARALQPLVYEHDGNYLSYGLKCLARMGELDTRQRSFLESYGRG